MHTRITIACDAALCRLAATVVAQHEPYLRRHRLLRLAIRQGLLEFRNKPELVQARLRDEVAPSP